MADTEFTDLNTLNTQHTVFAKAETITLTVLLAQLQGNETS